MTPNTFAIELNSTGKTITVGSGTATPLSWVGIGEVVSGSGFDGTSAVIDKTNLVSVAKEKGVGLQDFGSVRLEVNIYDADAGQVALKAAKSAQTRKNFKVTYPDSTTRTFYGYVMSFPEKFGVDSNITGVRRDPRRRRRGLRIRGSDADSGGVFKTRSRKTITLPSGGEVVDSGS